MLNRACIEKWRHERDLVILAAVIQLCAVLPAVPQGADDFDLLAQFSGYRLGPGLTESPLNVRLDLCTQPQDKSSVGLGGEVPGSIRNIRWRTGEGHGDRCPGT